MPDRQRGWGLKVRGALIGGHSTAPRAAKRCSGDPRVCPGRSQAARLRLSREGTRPSRAEQPEAARPSGARGVLRLPGGNQPSRLPPLSAFSFTDCRAVIPRPISHTPLRPSRSTWVGLSCALPNHQLSPWLWLCSGWLPPPQTPRPRSLVSHVLPSLSRRPHVTWSAAHPVG